MRCTGREHRGRAHVEQRLHVGLRHRPADHDLDVAHARRSQRLDRLAGEPEVRAREDGEADEVDVFLQRDRGDHVGLLADAGVDDFEARVAQRPGDQLGAPVVSVEARLRHQHPHRHAMRSSPSEDRRLPVLAPHVFELVRDLADRAVLLDAFDQVGHEIGVTLRSVAQLRPARRARPGCCGCGAPRPGGRVAPCGAASSISGGGRSGAGSSLS